MLSARAGGRTLPAPGCAGNRADRAVLVFVAAQRWHRRRRAHGVGDVTRPAPGPARRWSPSSVTRSEEHTSELQSLMRISYAVFCLNKKIFNISLLFIFF